MPFKWIRSLPLAVLTRRLQFGPQISGEVGEMPTPSSNIRNPECLLIHFGPFQATVRKLGLFQSKKGEMRQIAEHGLKPTMLGQNLAHSPILKFIRVERQHRDVLRSARSGD